MRLWQTASMWLGRLPIHSCTQLISNERLRSFRVQIFVNDRIVLHLAFLSSTHSHNRPVLFYDMLRSVCDTLCLMSVIDDRGSGWYRTIVVWPFNTFLHGIIGLKVAGILWGATKEDCYFVVRADDESIIKLFSTTQKAAVIVVPHTCANTLAMTCLTSSTCWASSVVQWEVRLDKLIRGRCRWTY